MGSDNMCQHPLGKIVLKNVPLGWRKAKCGQKFIIFEVKMADIFESSTDTKLEVVVRPLERGNRAIDDLKISEAVARKLRSEQDLAAAKIPVIDGFVEFAADDNLLKYHIEGNKNPFGLEIYYLNEGGGIGCNSRIPGDSKCLWGMSKFQYSIVFDSSLNDIILPYILKLVNTIPEMR